MLTPEQINDIRTKSGLKPIQSANSDQPKQSVGRFDYLLNEKKGFVDTVKEAFNKRGTQNAEDTANVNPIRAALRTTGAGAGFVNDVIGAGMEAVAPNLTKKIGEVVGKVAQTDTAQGILTAYNAFKDKHPEAAKDLEASINIASLIPEFKAVDIGGSAVKAGVEASMSGVKTVGKTIAKTGEKLDTPLKAISQTGSELAERVPRAISRVKESANEAVLRAERLKNATPEVANAIKSKLDDKFINTVAEVDNPTRKAFKQVVDIADETPKTVGLKKQPSIVSGELASKQFDIINKEKQTVGKQLGEKVKQLSKTEKVDMSSGFRELDDTLSNQGIQLQYTKKGVKLDFSGTKYTPAERTKIQELYNLASEGGTNLSPSNIHGKDQLFSKLQREANMEGVGKIMVDTPEGSKSLFSVFRDVFSKNLEEVSPEIRELNKKYRDLSLATEDIEDSILKTPNFNITRTADPAEFAKVNLRRIFGEAQSSPVFEAIADQMDSLSRQLGYTDASPKKVAEFAQELRKLYPESVPKTGFSGSISTGVKGAVGDALEATLKAGAPNLNDQRKALRILLESYIKKSP